MSERGEITFSSPQDFHNRYAHLTVEVPTDRGIRLEPAPKAWFKSPGRRQYEGVVFAPGREVHGFYNLWQGFAVEPRQGDWGLFRSFIFDVICNRVDEHFCYVMSWLARLLQDPGGERPGTAIVLRGKMGTGKGFFANTIGAVLGVHYASISQPSQVIGRFNNHLANKLLILVDEGFWAGDKAAEGVIKSLITEPYQMVEAKGKDAIRIESHVNLMFASNHSWVIPAGLEERRFFVSDASDRRQQDHAYFAAIHKQMFQEGGLEAMLFDLLKYDYSKVNLRQIPRTKGLFEQIISSMNTVRKFWFGALKEGVLLQGGGQEAWPDWVIGDHLYQDYLNFCERHHDRFPLVKTQFFIELRKMCSGIKSDRRRTSEGRFAGHRIPLLEECRGEFDRLVGMPIDWDDLETAENGDRIPF